MQDKDIIGLAIRETPLVLELQALEKVGHIKGHEGEDVFYDWRDRVPPYAYKWYSPESEEWRFAYEWRRQFIEEDYIYFSLITRAEIRTAEEYEATREKLSGAMYLL